MKHLRLFLALLLATPFLATSARASVNMPAAKNRTGGSSCIYSGTNQGLCVNAGGAVTMPLNQPFLYTQSYSCTTCTNPTTSNFPVGSTTLTGYGITTSFASNQVTYTFPSVGFYRVICDMQYVVANNALSWNFSVELIGGSTTATVYGLTSAQPENFSTWYPSTSNPSNSQPGGGYTFYVNVTAANQTLTLQYPFYLAINGNFTGSMLTFISQGM